jgi:hypothetical protein
MASDVDGAGRITRPALRAGSGQRVAYLAHRQRRSAAHRYR